MPSVTIRNVSFECGPTPYRCPACQHAMEPKLLAADAPNVELSPIHEAQSVELEQKAE